MNTQPKRRTLSGKVVVITGASSGIGRSTSLAFARAGADIVLAARRADALEQVARECETCGVRTLVVPTDVSIADQIERLANVAVERFGHIDVWVNNAAVLMMGRFEDLPLDAFRRVMETNFFGRLYGTRAALRRFRAQNFGTLIDVNSVLGRVEQPYASAYVASKFAVRGLVQSLRTELFDSPNIHICGVLPAPIDTPIYQEAANFTGKELRAMWPTYDPSVVARAIVRQAIRPRRQVIAGGFGRLLTVLNGISPNMTAWAARAAVDWIQIGSRPAPPTMGNLYQPAAGLGSVTGGWQARYRSATLLTAGALLLLVPLSAAVVVSSRRKAHRLKHSHSSPGQTARSRQSRVAHISQSYRMNRR